MELKDLLIHVDASAESDVRVEIAAELARRHDAHVTGLYVVDLVPYVADVATGAIAGRAGMIEAVSALRQRATEEPHRVEARFRARLDAAGVAGEWRLAENVVAPTVALHARYADLTMLGQINPDNPPLGTAADLVEHVMFAAGRPVLVIPYIAKPGPIGRNVLVGWNGSREAARALNDAIPFIAGADTVTVLAINPRHGIAGDGDVPAADIALHLARHNMRVAADHVVTEIAEGDALLDYAADRGCDLIVAGGYGHSRLREFALGGVTRTLLRSMTVPVLLSH
jgi:nucleotide-binding universal stress UspA family protein